MMKWQGRKAYTHIIQEVTETRRREEQLKVEAHHDKLTGVGNRFFFQEKADELLATGERMIFCYCMSMIHLGILRETGISGILQRRCRIISVKEMFLPESVETSSALS